MKSYFLCKYCGQIERKGRTWGHYFNHGLGSPTFEIFKDKEKKSFNVVMK